MDWPEPRLCQGLGSAPGRRAPTEKKNRWALPPLWPLPSWSLLGATLTSVQEPRPDIPRARRVFNHWDHACMLHTAQYPANCRNAINPPPQTTPRELGPENPGSRFDRRISSQSGRSPGVGRSSPLFWELGGGPSVAGSGIWTLLIWKPPCTHVWGPRPSGHL
jgi:hypothetical protein